MTTSASGSKPEPAKPARKPTTEEVLALFLRNLQTIRDWYRAAPGRGVELGHIMMGEISAGDTASALEAALQGRTWEPPKTP